MMLKFELSEQMVAAIAQALGNAPYNVAAPVLTEMQKQVDAQRQIEKQTAAPAGDEMGQQQAADG